MQRSNAGTTLWNHRQDTSRLPNRSVSANHRGAGGTGSAGSPRGRRRADAGARRLDNPIVFVTQVPVPPDTGDLIKIGATFGNHSPDAAAADSRPAARCSGVSRSTAPRRSISWARSPGGVPADATASAAGRLSSLVGLRIRHGGHVPWGSQGIGVRAPSGQVHARPSTSRKFARPCVDGAPRRSASGSPPERSRRPKGCSTRWLSDFGRRPLPQSSRVGVQVEAVEAPARERLAAPLLGEHAVVGAVETRRTRRRAQPACPPPGTARHSGATRARRRFRRRRLPARRCSCRGRGGAAPPPGVRRWRTSPPRCPSPRWAATGRAGSAPSSRRRVRRGSRRARWRRRASRRAGPSRLF